MTRRIRKVLSLLLAVAMLFSAAGTVYGERAQTPASDISGHFAQKQLQRWLEEGWLKGYADGTVRPNKTISRAEFVTLVNRVFGFQDKSDIRFVDMTSGHWAYSEVQIALKAGFMSGYQDRTFRPNQAITRQEVATVIASVLGLTPSPNGADGFADAASIAAWSKASVGAVASKGIMAGDEMQRFLPAKSTTRAEAVVALDNALQARNTVYRAAGVYGPETGTLTVKGNVVVAAAGVTLRNIVIEGDLTLSEEIGDGDAFLKNVTVHGTTTVKGGGANSIHFEDSVLLTIIVDKANGTVRIVAEGKTKVETVVVQTPVTIEETNVTEEGFKDINLAKQLPADSKVTLKGSFEALNIAGAQIQVEIPSGSIKNVKAEESASGTKVNLGDEAKVLNLVLDAAVNMLGKGEIVSATVSEKAKDGTSFEKQPTKLEGSTPTGGTAGGGTGGVGTGGGGSGGGTGGGGNSGGNAGSNPLVISGAGIEMHAMTENEILDVRTKSPSGNTVASGLAITIMNSEVDSTVTDFVYTGYRFSTTEASYQLSELALGQNDPKVTRSGGTSQFSYHFFIEAYPNNWFQVIFYDKDLKPLGYYQKRVNLTYLPSDHIMISRLDSQSSTFATDVAIARMLYDKLSDRQKELVMNYQKLIDAEEALKQGQGGAGSGGTPVPEPGKSTKPSAESIKVSNNKDAVDSVMVQGLLAGDIVKIYTAATGGTSIATGTAIGTGIADIKVPQLGTESGVIYVTVTSGAKTESDRVARGYFGETIAAMTWGTTQAGDKVRIEIENAVPTATLVLQRLSPYAALGQVTAGSDGKASFEVNEDESIGLYTVDQFLGGVKGNTTYPLIRPEIVNAVVDEVTPSTISITGAVPGAKIWIHRILGPGSYSRLQASGKDVSATVSSYGEATLYDIPPGNYKVTQEFNAAESDLNATPELTVTALEVPAPKRTVNIGVSVSETGSVEGTMYLVAKGIYSDEDDLTTAVAATKGVSAVSAEGQNVQLNTAGLPAGIYNIYSVDAGGQLSAPSENIYLVPTGFTPVENAIDLNYIHQNTSGKYIQVADIDLEDYLSEGGSGYHNGKGWVPIRYFSGIYDGNGYTIDHLKINRPDQPYGTAMFGLVYKGTIKNTRLTNVDIRGDGDVAALMGGTLDGATIINSSSTGTVVGNNYVGGLIGSNDDGATITDSFSTATVNGKEYVGGLIGYHRSRSAEYMAILEDSYATGNVTGTRHVGGLIGSIDGGIVKNSYATGTVDGDESVGGLAGYATGYSFVGTIEGSHATGAVTGKKYVGGLIGYSQGGLVAESYATGVVTGNDGVGGIAGAIALYAVHAGTIEKSYAIGNVNGIAIDSVESKDIGGLVGYIMQGKVLESYAKGTVDGHTNVGGVAGNNQYGFIQDAYATGAVSGDNHVGGLAGTMSSGTMGGELVGTVANSYTLSHVTGVSQVGGLAGSASTDAGVITASFYLQGEPDNGIGAAKSDADLKDPSTFTGWDVVGVWVIDGTNYPEFVWDTN